MRAVVCSVALCYGVLGGNLLVVAVSGLGVFVRQGRWAAGLVSGLLLALLGWGRCTPCGTNPCKGPA